MNNRTHRIMFFLVGFFFFGSPAVSFAVMPPDFIFNIGVQVIQFFSAVLIFFAATFTTFFKFFKAKFYALKHKKTVVVITVISTLCLSLGGAYFFAIMKQDRQYRLWLKESRKYNEVYGKVNPYTLMTNKDGANEGTSSSNELGILEENPFYQNHTNIALEISNEDLENTIKSNRGQYIILDARENIEVENGYFPDSLHIRFADLKVGRWKELPRDKFIYVYCWTGMRGKDVADFLRSKHIVASSFREGASGWCDHGGVWVGKMNFKQKYTEERYNIVFSTEEVRKMVSDGVVLVDARQPYKFQRAHIPGSISIPTMSTPTSEYEKVFSQVPPKSRVITVCDDYLNAFDARVVGIELERRGHKFLGRYNKPWDYGK